MTTTTTITYKFDKEIQPDRVRLSTEMVSDGRIGISGCRVRKGQEPYAIVG
jgi:hypothetical protein